MPKQQTLLDAIDAELAAPEVKPLVSEWLGLLRAEVAKLPDPEDDLDVFDIDGLTPDPKTLPSIRAAVQESRAIIRRMLGE